MTDWCGGSGQVKWLTDVVAGGKSNDWLMRWYGNTMSSASTSSISSASTSTSSDWWCGGSGPVKWLTDVVAGGKSNDWLMQWYGNTLCLALALALSLALALTDDMVAVGKSNDWLMWWQWASQMTDWCDGGASQMIDWCGGGKSNDWPMW